MTTHDEQGDVDARAGLQARFVRLRPVLVALHVVAVVLLALPTPQVSDKELAKPSVQAWFRRTAASLRDLGVPVTSEGLQGAVVGPGRVYTSALEALRKPAVRYADVVGAHQSWRMFAGVPGKSARLVIEVEEGGQWRTIHVSRSAAHPWRRSWFDHLRTRTLVHPFTSEEQRGRYRRLHKHLLPIIAQDFPDAARARFSMERVLVPAPDALRRAGGLIPDERYWVVELEVPK